MKLPRLSIASLMAIVLIVALDFGAGKSLRARVAGLLSRNEVVAEVAAETEALKPVGAPKGSKNAAKPREPINSTPEPAIEEGEIKCVVNTFNRRGSTNAEYLTARIARDEPEIHERMKAGEFKSVRQAAIEADIIKPRVSLPLDPDGAARCILRHFQGERYRQLIRALMAQTGD